MHLNRAVRDVIEEVYYALDSAHESSCVLVFFLGVCLWKL